MAPHSEKRMRYIRRAWHWVSERFYQDVPEQIAVCQFECQQAECTAKCPIRAKLSGRQLKLPVA